MINENIQTFVQLNVELKDMNQHMKKIVYDYNRLKEDFIRLQEEVNKWKMQNQNQ